MNKKEYNAWLNTLVNEDDADMMDIVNTARQAAWRIDTIWKAEEKAEIMEVMGCEDESDWNRNIKEGWISMHGKYIVTWYDGI